MRIALVPSAYAPAVGGVEELTAKLARRLQRAGDEVEVWTIRHPAELPADETLAGIRVRRFAMAMPRLAARSLATLPLELHRSWQPLVAAARSLRPDVIHVQCFSANGAYATGLAGRTRTPLVVTLQGETVMDDGAIYDRSVTLRTALRGGLRRATAVTGCSQFVLADAERRFGLAAGRGEVIPNGVELGESAEHEPLALPFDRFVLGLGRVVEKKGFDLLLDAFATLARAHPELGLVIAGEGAARDGLVASAARAGFGPRVAFPGALARAQVAWAMAHARAFVLPSRVEPFGIVVLEALRAGCPAIVSRHGGATEIVRDGIEGIVVDPADRRALAGAIDRVLGDAALARTLAQAGRARVAAFDWEHVAGRYREIYERVAA